MNCVEKYYKRELAVAFLTGSLPCVIISYCDGVETALAVYNAINPTTSMAWYVLFLLFPYIFPALTNWALFDRQIHPKGLGTFLKEVFKEAGGTLLNIYRAAVGFSAIIVVPIALIAPSALSITATALSFVFAFGCLIACCYLSNLQPR